MKSYDFIYDDIRLSDLGYIICKFDSSGVETISNGSTITFNTTPTLNGMKHELTSSIYEECLTATFQICKNLCLDANDEISLEDMRDIMRWLNRKEFHKLRFLDDEYSGIYFEASFNVSKIEIGGRLCGFELEMFTNRPFGLGDPVTLVVENTKTNGDISFFSKSDEEGYIYPNMEIEMKSDGDLEIYSITEDRTMRIANCQNGETIYIDYPIISSSMSSHKIQNDFNWIFFRMASSFKNRCNDIIVSLPCSIRITYSPIVKVGI